MGFFQYVFYWKNMRLTVWNWIMVSNHNHERFFSSFGIKTKKSRVSQSILLVLGTCQMYLKLNSSVGLTAVLRGKLSTLAPPPWCGAEALLEPGELSCSCTALLCGADGTGQSKAWLCSLWLLSGDMQDYTRSEAGPGHCQAVWHIMSFKH